MAKIFDLLGKDFYAHPNLYKESELLLIDFKNLKLYEFKITTDNQLIDVTELSLIDYLESESVQNELRITIMPDSTFSISFDLSPQNYDFFNLEKIEPGQTINPQNIWNLDQRGKEEQCQLMKEKDEKENLLISVEKNQQQGCIQPLNIDKGQCVCCDKEDAWRVELGTMDKERLYSCQNCYELLLAHEKKS